MRGTTHMAGGVAAVLACTLVTKQPLSSPLILLASAAGAAGSLLPDIDHPNSKITNKAKPVGVILSFIFSHRGLFHAPALYLLLLALWCVLAPEVLLFYGNMFFLGIFSHLTLDALNAGGIPVFFPFETKRRRLLNLRTGGFVEVFLRIGLTLLCILLFKKVLFPTL